MAQADSGERIPAWAVPSSTLRVRLLHIPLTVFGAATLFIEGEQKDIVELGTQRLAVCLVIATLAVGDGALPLDQHRLIVAVIGTGGVTLVEPGLHDGIASARGFAIGIE